MGRGGTREKEWDEVGQDGTEFDRIGWGGTGWERVVRLCNRVGQLWDEVQRGGRFWDSCGIVLDFCGTTAGRL